MISMAGGPNRRLRSPHSNPRLGRAPRPGRLEPTGGRDPRPRGGLFGCGRFVGEGGSFSYPRAWIFRADRDGNNLWEKILGEDDGLYSLTSLGALEGGGVAAAGYAPDSTGTSSGWLFVIDADGNEVVNRRYIGVPGGYNAFHQVVPTQDGGFILAGAQGGSDYQGWAMRTDGDGNPIWNRLYGEEGYSVFNDVLEVENGDLIFCGEEEPGGSGSDTQSWAVRSDADGHIQWNRYYGEPGADYGNHITAAWHGNAVISSNHYLDGIYSPQLREISGDGDEHWVRTFNETDPLAYTWEVIATPDGGFAMSFNQTVDDQRMGSIVRTNGDGVELWTQSFGIGGFAGAIAPSDDGGFFLGMAFAGDAGGESYMLKTTPESRGLIVRVLDTPETATLGEALKFTIRAENLGQEVAGLTRAVFWAKSGSQVDYRSPLYDGRPFEIAPGSPFHYPFSMKIPSGAPLGDYEAGITIYDGDTELFSDGFVFEMLRP